MSSIKNTVANKLSKKYGYKSSTIIEYCASKYDPDTENELLVKWEETLRKESKAIRYVYGNDA